jgi:DNA-binding NarL/FixJ family response regulator
MAILLSSANSPVVTRWAGLLNERFETEKAQSLDELKTLCASRKFDAILLHRMLIDMPAFSGLINTSPAARFFLLSDRPDEEDALLFLKLGIVGYGNTYISSPRLIEALGVITNGGVWLGQKIIQRLIMDTSGNAKGDGEKDTAGPAMAKLTKAERHIAEFIARGQSNLEIAANLNITERTVKAHLTSIYAKTKTGNRLNLALLINLGKSPQG